MLALKYRPQVFEHVLGQDHITAFLKSSLNRGLQDTSYLFCGSHGSGKTTIARLMARTLLCENPINNNPCNQCPTCISVYNDKHPDYIEIDAASQNGVDDIRRIKEEILFSPVLGKRRVIVFDECHMFTPQAQNAMLKILEEHSNTTTFLFCTTDPSKMLDTVKSRCITLWIKEIPQELIIGRLAQICTIENMPFTNKGLEMVTIASKNHMRDALTTMEQVYVAKGEINDVNVGFILGLPTVEFLKEFTLSLKDNFKGFLSVIYSHFDLKLFIREWQDYLVKNLNNLTIYDMCDIPFNKDELIGIIHIVTEFYTSKSVNDRNMFEYLLSLLKCTLGTTEIQNLSPFKVSVNKKDIKGNYKIEDVKKMARRNYTATVLPDEDIFAVFGNIKRII